MIDPSTPVYYNIIKLKLTYNRTSHEGAWTLHDNDSGGEITFGELMALYNYISKAPKNTSKWMKENNFPLDGTWASILVNCMLTNSTYSLPFINELILNERILFLPKIELTMDSEEGLMLETEGGCVLTFSEEDTGELEFNDWLEEGRGEVSAYDWDNY